MRQQRESNETSTKENILEETGNFLIDIAKMVFGGVILVGIMQYEDISPWLVFGLGGLIVVFCFLSGLILTTIKRKEQNNMELLVFFGVVGVIAACLGIYGLIELRKQDAKHKD